MTLGVCLEQLEGWSYYLLSWAEWKEQRGDGEFSFDMFVEDAQWISKWKCQVGSWTHE